MFSGWIHKKTYMKVTSKRKNKIAGASKKMSSNMSTPGSPLVDRQVTKPFHKIASLNCLCSSMRKKLQTL